jgi:hypothetical protein
MVHNLRCFQESAITPNAGNRPEMKDQPSRQTFPVSVVLERRPAASRWAEFTWRASGIVPGQRSDDSEMTLIHESEDSTLFLFAGLDVSLFKDECESYYFNLVSESPRAYVLAHQSSLDAPPEPFRVSLSYDEAHAYLEGDDEVYAVEIPAELYRSTEEFVIANYFPEKKTKRKLRDWSADEHRRPQ